MDKYLMKPTEELTRMAEVAKKRRDDEAERKRKADAVAAPSQIVHYVASEDEEIESQKGRDDLVSKSWNEIFHKNEKKPSHPLSSFVLGSGTGLFAPIFQESKLEVVAPASQAPVVDSLTSVSV